MSEETAQPQDGQEQSMEDILASIRGILSEEDGEEEAAKEADEPAAAAPPPDSVSAAPEPEPELGAAPEPEPEPAAAPEPAPELVPSPEPAATVSEPAVAAPAPESKPEPAAATSEFAPMPTPESTPLPGPMEEILELTPDMVASGVISATTARASTDVLSELAAAVLDRRDMAVGASSSEMTLEGIVRGMLKPILSEWLDRNLPYLIERLVKKEIDHMINRAERLDS